MPDSITLRGFLDEDFIQYKKLAMFPAVYQSKILFSVLRHIFQSVCRKVLT